MKKNLFIKITALISAAALVSVITACAGDTQGKTTSGSASVTNTSESTASSSQTTETTKATTATQATECRHEYGEWTVISESTCAEQGSKTRSCLKCGGGKMTVILPPVAHKYEEKIIPPTKSEDGCTRYTCGECGKSYEQDVVPAIGSQGLEYTLIDGTENYAVIGIGTCTDTEIVIPQLYKGFPVTSVIKKCDKSHLNTPAPHS